MPRRYSRVRAPSCEQIAEAKEILDNHMGPGHFNQEGWEYILEAHGGKLPIAIKAVPEGTVVPTKNVLFTMVRAATTPAHIHNALTAIYLF